MLWIEAVRELSADLSDPFELEFTWRALHQEMDKLTWLSLQREKISENDYLALKNLSEKLKNHIPPQYIIGWADFFDSRFKVDGRVLIPRPETEELVQMILAENGNQTLKVLDIGTGSGAIAVSLAKIRPDWLVTASDISEAALDLAHENAEQNGVKVNFVKSDVLDDIFGQYDLIVSNPPYISLDDKDEVDQSVDSYEPALALYAENEGLAIYEKIAKQAPEHLTTNGKIYLEIGYKEGPAVKAMFETAFPGKTVTVHQDIFGKDRMVSVK